MSTRPILVGIVTATVTVLFASILTLSAGAQPPEAAADYTGVHHSVSCLAGNGRVDTNLMNMGDDSARYRIEFGTLSAREYTVDSRDWWRSPVTGRADGTYEVIVTRDGDLLSSRNVEVNCDDDVTVTSPEVEVLVACRGDAANRGYVLIQFVNDSDVSKPYIVKFEGVRNRSTTAAAWGQSLRAVTGRPNGAHDITITSEGATVYQGTVEVDCPPLDGAPEPTPEPTPTEIPTPLPTPSPELSVSDGFVSDGVGIGFGGISIGGGIFPGPIGGGGEPPQAGTLTAADIDDNLNFNFFSGYLNWAQQGNAELPSAVLSDRLTINLVDGDGQPLSNAELAFSGSLDSMFLATTDAGGTARIFPTYSGITDPIEDGFQVTDPATGNNLVIDLDGSEFDESREATIVVPNLSGALPEALDVAFVIDATGSMGDEMAYLKTEFAAIVQEVESRHPDVDMQFALIVYRDTGDQYVVRTFDFASSASMLVDLDAQSANGGGDYPEAMEEALEAAVGLTWRDNANVSKVVILNADAPPHDENLEAALSFSRGLARKGVRIYPLAASGVAETAEYLMRVMAATTGGRHLFLTDDSGVGGTHQEPLIPCQVVTRLDNLLVRVLDAELAGERVEATDNEVIRTVGEGTAGVCELDEFTAPEPPDPCQYGPVPVSDVAAVGDLLDEPISILPPLPPYPC